MKRRVYSFRLSGYFFSLTAEGCYTLKEAKAFARAYLGVKRLPRFTEFYK